MHRAPVVGILVLDGHSVPLPEPLEVAHDLSKSPDMQGSHQLLVVSEEQFKVLHSGDGIPGNSRDIRGLIPRAQMTGLGLVKLCMQLAYAVRGCRGTGKQRGLWGVPGPRSVVGTLKQDLSVGGTGNADVEGSGRAPSWCQGHAETEQASLESWVASGGRREVVSGVWPWV